MRGFVRAACAAALATLCLFAALAPSRAEDAPVPAPLAPGFGMVPPEEVPREIAGIDGSAEASFVRRRVYENGLVADSYARDPAIRMGAGSDYAKVDGVLTFRGNNYRDTAAFGFVPEGASKLEPVWSVKVGHIDEWSGVGWTGQAAVVRWPDETREAMRINPDKKNKPGLTEVIYAALDGKIRFLDLADGETTRPDIDVGAPIKGSVSIDPRGYPLLYCGQGIFTVGGRAVRIGTRVFSLIDQKLLFFLDGRDRKRTRNWFAFDASPLVDAGTDALLQTGENGLVYLVRLNTHYDPARRTISIRPEVDRYAYKYKVEAKLGIENSLAVYNHYGYFADNVGVLQCVDLNTLRCVWAVRTGDDTDASIALEETEGGVALYTGNELDHRDKGKCNLRRIDALTGRVIWQRDVVVRKKDGAGLFGSPAVGKGRLKDLVYFSVAKTDEGGTLLALNKGTGETVWSAGLGAYGWSSPVLVYDRNGRGCLLAGNSKGVLRLMDAETGKLLDFCDLGQNIEGSPVVFDDMLVVGTRGGRIVGVRIR
jgi:outer membrane protein assembly factor BamB